jgi:hypothetical protein
MSEAKDWLCFYCLIFFFLVTVGVGDRRLGDWLGKLQM